jgi:hypothetical protein
MVTTVTKIAVVLGTLVWMTMILPSNLFAGGPRMDWDERYENIPGAPQCWIDGFDDGQNGPFNHNRNEECVDKGNQYYRAFLVGCEDAGNTKDICESATDG